MHGWLVLVGAFASTSTLVKDALNGEPGPTRTLEYKRAQDLIDQRFGPLDQGQAGNQNEAAGGRPTLTEFVLITSDSVPSDNASLSEHAQEFGEKLDGVAGSLLVGSFNDYQAIICPQKSLAPSPTA